MSRSGDELSEASVNFYVTVCAISFGIVSFASAMEVITRARSLDDGFQLLTSIVQLAIFLIICSLLPLLFDGQASATVITSTFFCVVGGALFVFNFMSILTGQVRVHHKLISATMFPITLLILIAISLSTADELKLVEVKRPVLATHELVLKLGLAWGLFALLLRFALFTRYITTHRSDRS